MSSHTYSSSFFAYIDAGARASARAVIAALQNALTASPASVLDLGCGRGVWLEQWLQAGATDILGVDGSYLDPDQLAIARDQFRSEDLSAPLDLGARFDLAQSFEVAEHLPRSSSASFVASLAAHSDLVAFSAATPGQGGEHHVNERPLAFWRDRFAEHGFRCFDCIRPAVAGSAEVEPWYRYNSLLYAREAALELLTPEASATELSSSEPIPDVSNLKWKLRRAVLAPLPEPVVTGLSKLHSRLHRTPAG